MLLLLWRLGLKVMGSYEVKGQHVLDNFFYEIERKAKVG